MSTNATDVTRAAEPSTVVDREPAATSEAGDESGAAAEALAHGPTARTHGPAAVTPLRRWAWLVHGVRGWSAFGLIVLMAVAAALVEPTVGWNATTLRLVSVLVVAFVLVNYSAALVHRVVGAGHRGRRRLVVRPIYLLVLLAGVALTRGASVEPVLLFGAVAGLSGAARDDDEAVSSDLANSGAGRGAAGAHLIAARQVVAATAWLAVLGMAAWLAYSYVAAHPFADLVRWDEIAVDRAIELNRAMTLATLVGLELTHAVAVVALVSLPVMLLPLAIFDGGALWVRSRFASIVTYVVAVAVTASVLDVPRLWAENRVTLMILGGAYVVYAMVGAVIALTRAARSRPASA